MSNTNQMKYGTGNNSSIGAQINTHAYSRKALIEVAKEMVFSPLADNESMPKHYGKTIKKFHYLPLLDDRNTTDQGLDASGLSVNQGVTIQIAWAGAGNFTHTAGQMHGNTVKGEGADAAAALLAAQGLATGALNDMGFAGVYADAKALAETAGFFVDESVAYPVTGNLYGSSKDVGMIASKLPTLSETGGRVNRVGFKRVVIEGTIESFGFFDEYTRDSLTYDTDSELEMHVHREMVRGANEINEDMIQMDLLNGAGVVMFAGDATSRGDMSPEGAIIAEVTYKDLEALAIELSNNRCPKQSKRIDGSKFTDTKVISDGFIMMIGSELIPTLKKMVDYHGEKALIEVKHYGDAGTIMPGELGSIDQFRIVVADEMQSWTGAGAVVAANPGYKNNGSNYNVFPMLVVGAGSFATIGLQGDGKNSKFEVNHKKPGSETADRTDPFGLTGFMSIQWNYGSIILRPERLALLNTLAQQ